MTVRRAGDRSATRPVRVLIVDDHRTFTDLLAVALADEPGLELVGAAHDAAQARAMVDELEPDAVLMDVNLGLDDGVEVTAALTRRYPDLGVVVLTAHADSELMQRAAEAGACGLLPKDGSLPEMLDGLRNARPGGLVVHPALLRKLVTAAPAAATTVPPLTRREDEVLQRLATGMEPRAIARHLGISLNTCRGYVKNLLMKLDAHSQLEAVAVARKHGLLGARDSR